MGETKSSGILVNTIPLSMEHVFNQESMNLVLLKMDTCKCSILI
jgi:hypothetical protein